MPTPQRTVSEECKTLGYWCFRLALCISLLHLARENPIWEDTTQSCDICRRCNLRLPDSASVLQSSGRISLCFSVAVQFDLTLPALP